MSQASEMSFVTPLTQLRPVGTLHRMTQVQSAAMPKTAKPKAQCTLRVPEEWLPRIDAIAKAMSRPGNEATRIETLLYLIEKGIAPAEKEQGIKSPAK